MSNDQVGCEWVSVSSGTGLPGLSRTKAVKRFVRVLAANRMTPSICPDPCRTRWGSWFQAILYHISAYFRRIFGVYTIRIFLKMPHKTDMTILRTVRHTMWFI